MPQNESFHGASCTPSQPRHREQPRVTLNTPRDFNEHTNNRRPNIQPLQQGMDISSSSTTGSYRATFEGRITANPSGTSAPGSSENVQNERHLADSDSHAKIELMLSNMEKTIRRMETKICALRNLNQQEKEGREVLQESCRRLEDAVRAREYEVSDLKRQLNEREQQRGAVQHMGTRNLRRRTEDDIARGNGPGGRGQHVELSPIGPPQTFPPPMEENIHPGRPWEAVSGPHFVGGFRPALRKM